MQSLDYTRVNVLQTAALFPSIRRQCSWRIVSQRGLNATDLSNGRINKFIDEEAPSGKRSDADFLQGRKREHGWRST